jgi:hypothetical protein
MPSIIAIFLLFMSQSLMAAEAPAQIVAAEPKEFAQFFAAGMGVVKKAPSGKRIASELGTREMIFVQKTGPEVPYEDQVAEVFVLDGKKKWQVFRIRGCKRLEASWADESLIKFEIWPSSAMQLVQFVDARTGKTVYRDARRHQW